MPRTLGLIAGSGRFPGQIARGARARGLSVCAVGFRGEVDSALEREVDELHLVHLGELGRLISILREAGVSRAVAAGKVTKLRLYEDPGAFRPDERALAFLAKLRDRKDDSILQALADLLEGEGIELRPQREFAPELFPGRGSLGERKPTDAQRRDLAFAWPLAKAIGGLDIGQTLVVRDRAVLAVEAIEGTDAAVLRGGSLAGGGAVVLKVAKPNQDPRFDLPTLGLDTLAALIETKGAVLAFEADWTVVLDRPELERAADAHDIAVVGVGPDGPGSEAP